MQANRVSGLPYPVQGRELPPKRTAKLGLSELDERQGERRKQSWNERVLQLDLSHARASPGLGPGLACQRWPCVGPAESAAGRASSVRAGLV